MSSINSNDDLSAIQRAKETRDQAELGILHRYKLKKTGLIIFALLAAGFLQLLIFIWLEN